MSTSSETLICVNRYALFIRELLDDSEEVPKIGSTAVSTMAGLHRSPDADYARALLDDGSPLTVRADARGRTAVYYTADDSPSRDYLFKTTAFYQPVELVLTPEQLARPLLYCAVLTISEQFNCNVGAHFSEDVELLHTSVVTRRDDFSLPRSLDDMLEGRRAFHRDRLLLSDHEVVVLNDCETPELRSASIFVGSDLIDFITFKHVALPKLTPLEWLAEI